MIFKMLFFPHYFVSQLFFAIIFPNLPYTISQSFFLP